MVMETELKFTVHDRAVFDGVRAMKRIGGYDLVDRGAAVHTDTYFDTGDLCMFNGKVILRMRACVDGTVLTFKAQARSYDGIYRRVEINEPVDITPEAIGSGACDDLPPMTALREQVGDIALAPSLTVRNNRHTIHCVREGLPQFEIVLDDVTFSGPRGEAHALELEVESLGGSDDDLSIIGRELSERFNLAPAGPSKYILGMKLLGNAE